MTDTKKAQEWAEANRKTIESSNEFVEKNGLPLAAQWIAENKEAFDCWNKYVEKNGLPLAKYTQFLGSGLKYVVFPEEEGFGARCLNVEVASDGPTEESAVEHLLEALELYFEAPEGERWVHTPDMKAKLARADAWMRDNPPGETDIESLKKKAQQHAAERVAACGSAQHLQVQFVLECRHLPWFFGIQLRDVAAPLGWTEVPGLDSAFSRPAATPTDAMELLQTFHTELKWFSQALESAWVTEVVSTYDLAPLMKVELPVTELSAEVQADVDASRAWRRTRPTQRTNLKAFAAWLGVNDDE